MNTTISTNATPIPSTRRAPARALAMLSIAAVGVIAGGCVASAQPDEAAGSTAEAVVGGGFYQTPTTGAEVFAVHADWTDSFCWVLDEGEQEAIGMTYFGNVWARPIMSTYSSIQTNYRQDLTPYNRCPWPNGMFVSENAVFLVYGASETAFGKSCHVTSNAQVEAFGGWGAVWQPNLPSNQMNFRLGSTFLNDCTTPLK